MAAGGILGTILQIGWLVTAEKMKPVVERKDPLVAPIAQNSRVGTLKMVADGKTITEAPLLALEQVNEAGIFGRAWDSVRLMMK